MHNKIKIKKGDEIIVLAGKDKGKTGKVVKVIPNIRNAIVVGINKVKKHQKPDKGQAGGIVEKEMPIHISNLAYSYTFLQRAV
jgi:large subunit ribosomal protein L24